MKAITIFIIGLFIFSIFVNVYFLVNNYIENKELDRRLEELSNDNSSPEFMKNGEWFNIILNGYSGEK